MKFLKSLLAIFTLSLLIYSCQKDGITEMPTIKDTATEINPSFKIAPDNILFEIITKVQDMEDNHSTGFLENYLQNHGLPKWDYSIIDYNESKENYSVSVPFVKDGIVTSMMLVNNFNEKLEIDIIEREAFDKLRVDSEDNYKVSIWFIPASRFLYFKYDIEENLDLELNNWIIEASNQQISNSAHSNQASQRCEGEEFDIVWWGYQGNNATTGSFTISIDCGGGGAGGFIDPGNWGGFPDPDPTSSNPDPNAPGGGRSGGPLSDEFPCSSTYYKTYDSWGSSEQIYCLNEAGTAQEIEFVDIFFSVVVKVKICVDHEGKESILECNYEPHVQLLPNGTNPNQYELMNVFIRHDQFNSSTGAQNLTVVATIFNNCLDGEVSQKFCRAEHAFTFHENPCGT